MLANPIAPGAAEATPPFDLRGDIAPRRVPLAYRVTLGLTALAMVLLPLAYVGLIVAAGWGVWTYAHVGTAIFEGSGGGIWRLLLYLAPLIAGVILVAFMIKPLFAPAAKQAPPLELDLQQQPHLRRLIAAICIRVGAPMPVRVDLDCQVNASARLRRGLLSLGRRDLVLTIGLPLASGLTARQFAGVLAHEFGHFAQGAGMALTYIIRSVNHWFARVVFQRDSWDQNLAEWSAGLDVRIGIIFYLARAAIWISRKILHGLMLIGDAIACLQLRQMEFDADYYATHVAGSVDFAATSRELRRLAASSETAFNELGALWHERRLVDDLPAFVALRRRQLTPEITTKLDASEFEQKTHWSDTHPSDRARIAKAQALQLPGIFTGDGPATELFADFAGLSRTATRHFYTEQLELQFQEDALLSTAAAAGTSDQVNRENTARLRLAGEVLNLTRPLTWSASDLAPAPELAAMDAAAVHAKLAALRAGLAAQREAAAAMDKAFNLLTDDRLSADLALAYRQLGVEIKPEAFALTSSQPAAIAKRSAELQRRIADKAHELRSYEAQIDAWVRLVVGIARTPSLVPKLPGDLAHRIEATAAALATFQPWFTEFPTWVGEQNVLSAFTASESQAPGVLFADALAERRTRAKSTVDRAATAFGARPWPHPPMGVPMTTVEFFSRRLDGVQGAARFTVFLETVVGLYFRLLGELAAQGEDVEKALAPDPSA